MVREEEDSDEPSVPTSSNNNEIDFCSNDDVLSKTGVIILNKVVFFIFVSVGGELEGDLLGDSKSLSCGGACKKILSGKPLIGLVDVLISVAVGSIPVRAGEFFEVVVREKEVFLEVGDNVTGGDRVVSDVNRVNSTGVIEPSLDVMGDVLTKVGVVLEKGIGDILLSLLTVGDGGDNNDDGVEFCISGSKR
jgi:hypothetical protein